MRIAEITEQYMAYLEGMKKLDMEIASDFLVMGATLVHIKSKMMLPGSKLSAEGSEGEDPREELVISLMRYKRCRVFAGELKERREKYDGMRQRTAMTAKDLGIDIDLPVQTFSVPEYEEAVAAVCARNDVRFADISNKITHILRRDRLSIKDRIKSLWATVANKGKIMFSELFKGKKTEKIDRIVSFLAVLELVRDNKVIATQKDSFDDILLEEKKD
jgi:segregation and condensation protein A